MRAASSLTPRGSTRRWRRIRAWVLARDGFACQFIIGDPLTGARCGAYATHVHHTEPRATAAAGSMVDDPDKLAAACATHNLENGTTGGLIAGPRPARRPEWSW